MDIFMTYKTLEEFNVTNADDLFSYMNVVWPGFTPILLFSFWIIIVLGSYFASKVAGKEKIQVSIAVASFLTFLLSMILTLKEGAINISTLVITFTVMIISVAWLLLSKDSNVY
jgi:hypothetical protein